MSYRENLSYMMKINQQAIKKLVDDVTEEESLERGVYGYNHIRWQIGHLVHCQVIILKSLGEKTGDFGNYKELFGGGSKIADDPSVYPSLAELGAQLYELQTRAIAATEKIPESDLKKEVDWGERKAPAWQAISFLCMHDFYHSGQIVNMRKILRREQPFG